MTLRITGGVPPTPGHVGELTDAGVSYRRLDTWTRAGYLRADNATPGIGVRRRWPPEERAVARLMVRLIDECGFTVEGAHRVARGARQLAPGIRLVIDVDQPPPASPNRGNPPSSRRGEVNVAKDEEQKPGTGQDAGQQSRDKQHTATRMDQYLERDRQKNDR